MLKLIPTTNKSPLAGFMWKKQEWSGRIDSNQNGVAIPNGSVNGGIGCLDYDKIEMFYKHERELIKHGASLVQTQKGMHAYFRFASAPFKVKHLGYGEARLEDCYNLFPSNDSRLTYSNRYKLITSFRPKLVSIEELDFLELDSPNPPKDPITISCITPRNSGLSIDSNDLESYLPTEYGQNHYLAFMLLRRLKINGNWPNKALIFEEWIKSNRFLRKPLNHYWDDFDGIVRYIEKTGVTQGLTGVIQEIKNDLKENLEESKDRQFIRGMCKRLSSFNINKEFFLSMNEFWDVDPEKRKGLPYPMHPMRVKRAIEVLVKQKAIIVQSKGKRWSKGQAELFSEGSRRSVATNYKWIGE